MINVQREGHGSCFASFGELVQGVLPGGRKFLVNLKIKNRSRVRVRITDCVYSQEKEALFSDSYRRFSKSYKVLRNIMVDIGDHRDLLLDVESNIPVGKGLSSSTADMVASIMALQSALSITLKRESIGRMITEIDPNDGLHYDHACAYHHTTGQLIYQFAFVPPLNIVGVDLGGSLDTVDFNSRPPTWDDADMAAYAELLKRVRLAFEAHDVPGLCALATQSTVRWQKHLPRPELDRALALAGETGALGVINTHSGTFLGLAYGAERKDIPTLLAAAERRFPECSVQLFQTTSCQE